MTPKDLMRGTAPSREGAVELDDHQLAEAQGGILLAVLLPAVQKAAAVDDSPRGGANVVLGDGSVRFTVGPK